MKKKVTIREVAKEAGVSVATVSRYLNKNGYLSGKAEMKIKEVMEELEYKPNEIARGLARQKTNTIAFIVPDIINPFFPELFSAIEQAVKEKGYRLILITTHEESLNSNSFWNSLKSRYTDGLILASFDYGAPAVKELEESGLPFIRIDRAADNTKEHSVGLDHYGGARMAVEHLIETGCRRIAHIAGPPDSPPSCQRLQGYKDAMAAFPGRRLYIMEGDFSLESGRRQTEALLAKHPEVDGLFMANDMMAIGALKGLKQMGRKVPDDLALIGFDGIKLTGMVDPEISTIEQPIYQIGLSAASRLIGLIEKKEMADSADLNVKLIKRASTLGFKPKR